MAELVDAQDLKSCGLIIRPGSIPGICTIETPGFENLNLVFYFFSKSFNSFFFPKQEGLK